MDMASSLTLLLLLFVGLVNVGCVPVVHAMDRYSYPNDYLLRDLSPQDETQDADCCTTTQDIYEMIPAQTLADVAQMSTQQFLEKFTPRTADVVQIIPDSPDIRVLYPSSYERPAVYAADGLPMQLPDRFVPIENHVPKTPKIDAMSSNFRLAKLLDQDPILDPPMAETAKCTPRDTMVLMPRPKNISLGIIPVCTTLKQCGGCCGDSSLTCMPTKTTTVLRKGIHFAWARNAMVPVGTGIVSLTEHLECDCKCRLNQSDCNANQQWDQPNCRCKCLNFDMANNCGPNRVWDPTSCQCMCPNASGTCPVGYHFDHNYYCSCIPNSSFRQSKKSQAPVAPAAAAYQRSFSARRSRSDRG